MVRYKVSVLSDKVKNYMVTLHSQNNDKPVIFLPSRTSLPSVQNQHIPESIERTKIQRDSIKHTHTPWV